MSDTQTKNTQMQLFDGARATDVSTARWILNQMLKIWLKLNITDTHIVSKLIMVHDVRPCVSVVYFISFNARLH